MSTEIFFRLISAFWPCFAPLPGLLRLFFLAALPSQCTCLLLFPLLPCLQVGFDFFSAWLLSPHGNCKLQENASMELNLDASYISVLLRVGIERVSQGAGVKLLQSSGCSLAVLRPRAFH